MDDLSETAGSGEALPAQGGAENGTAGWLPWLIIGIATLVLVVGNIWVNELKEENTTGSDLDQLAILKFQAKTLIGAKEMAKLRNQPLDFPGEQLREAMPNADLSSLAAIAALENFLRPDGDEESRDKILADVEGELELVSDRTSGAEILQKVRSSISDPTSLSDNDWSHLKDSLGWFGKLLAASEGGPDRDQAREIRAAGMRLSILWMLGLFLLCMAVIAGAGLLFFAIWKYLHGELKLRLAAPEPGAAGVLLECFAVYLAAMAAIELLMIFSLKIDLRFPAIVAYGALIAPVLCAVFWGLVFRARHKGLRQAAGIQLGEGFFKEVACGFLGYVAILPVVALGIAATIGVTMLVAGMSSGQEGASPAPISHPIVAEIAKGDWRILLGVLALASIAAPLFEESLFRGAFHGGMRGRRFHFWAAALISAVIFAAIHPQGLMAIPALGAMGFGFSMLREWRGSLIAPMTAHAFHNGTLVLVMWTVLGG